MKRKNNKPSWKAKDQYYTNKDVAKHCYDISVKKLEDFTGRNSNDVIFYEPAAGEGAFFDLFPKDRRIGIDIDPKGEDIIQDDFLTRETPDRNKIYWSITNPPYGYRNKLSRDFFNRLCIFCEAIVFIAPHSFTRYENAQQLLKTHRLIYEETLDVNSFHTPDGKKYKIPTQLSIWVKTNRVPLIKKQPTTHPDFEMCHTRYKDQRQKNRKTVSDYNFDYNLVFETHYFKKDKSIIRDLSLVIDENDYLLFKCSDEVADRLCSIDWDEVVKDDPMGNMNKSRVVEGYTKKYGDGSYMPDKPKTTHPDFDIYYYRTDHHEKTKHFIDKDWDLAFQDIYFNNDKIVYDKKDIVLNKHWFFIKCKNDEVKKRLEAIDWGKETNVLMKGNMSLHMIVGAYTKYYGDGS